MGGLGASPHPDTRAPAAAMHAAPTTRPRHADRRRTRRRGSDRSARYLTSVDAIGGENRDAPEPAPQPWGRHNRLRGMRIDTHAHVHPAAYREALGDVSLPSMTLGDLEEAMEGHGIDAAVLSTGPPAAFLGPTADGRDLA